jgi:uncharacterized protein YdhG (YjbR/CyaY superfamily)
MRLGMPTKKSPQTINAYIGNHPTQIQRLLQEMRQAVRDAIPEAGEAISYGIPTFKLRGKNLVHFAAFKNHIGFYPTSSGISAFKKQLSKYKTSKGTVQFPLDEPIPYDLVIKITRFRVSEVSGKGG